jgi:HEXXH motif-containing protein
MADDGDVTGWFEAAADDTGLASAWRDHVERDLSALERLATTGASHWVTLAAAVRRDPDVLRRLPGCAGIHLMSGTPDAGPPVDRRCRQLAAEAAAETGLGYEWHGTLAGDLLLYLVGVRVRTGGEPVELTAQPGRLSVRCPSGTAEFEFAGAAWRTVGASLPVDEILAVGGLRVTPDEPLYRVALPPTFEIDDAPSAAKLGCAEGAMRLIRRVWPELHDELSTMRVPIIPLDIQPPVTRRSFSNRRLPNALYASLIDPFELADLVCHEYHHLKLFLAEERHGLLRNPDLLLVSPFRADRRTADGVLHACYVFHQIAALFDRIFTRWQPSTRGSRRIAAQYAAVENGLRVLAEAGADYTPFGRRFAAELSIRNAERLAMLEAGDQAAVHEARSAVREHLRQAGTPRSREAAYLVA